METDYPFAFLPFKSKSFLSRVMEVKNKNLKNMKQKTIIYNPKKIETNQIFRKREKVENFVNLRTFPQIRKIADIDKIEKFKDLSKISKNIQNGGFQIIDKLSNFRKISEVSKNEKFNDLSKSSRMKYPHKNDIVQNKNFVENFEINPKSKNPLIDININMYFIHKNDLTKFVFENNLLKKKFLVNKKMKEDLDDENTDMSRNSSNENSEKKSTEDYYMLNNFSPSHKKKNQKKFFFSKKRNFSIFKKQEEIIDFEKQREIRKKKIVKFQVNKLKLFWNDKKKTYPYTFKKKLFCTKNPFYFETYDISNKFVQNEN